MSSEKEIERLNRIQRVIEEKKIYTEATREASKDVILDGLRKHKDMIKKDGYHVDFLLTPAKKNALKVKTNE